jgi:hypothetical protein
LASSSILRFNTEGSTLALLMTGIGADHVDHAAATDDLAVLTDPFDAGTDFHGETIA